MRRERRPSPSAAVRLLAAAFAASAALAAVQVAPSGLQAILEHAIIGPELALAEVRVYTERRVPVLAPPSSTEAWRVESERLRRDLLDRIVFRGEAARWRAQRGRVVWLETIEGGPGYRIRKLRYEALPGLWIPALLYEPERLEGRVPVALHVNGHEAIGKAVGYKQIRTINVAKRGMLALNVEWLGMGQLRTDGFVHYRMNQLDLAGTSGLAPFYLAMERALDLLLEHPNADPERVAVSGLSGGGWQTIVISALDTRVKLSNPVAGYSSYRTRAGNKSDLGDSEQTPSDLATIVDYTHLTAMLAPRASLLTYNSKDNCCFAAAHALPPLVAAARPYFELLGRPERLRTHVNDIPGTHNFERENREAFYRILVDTFQPDAPPEARVEIPSDAEIKTAEQLAVELPALNTDLHLIALALARNLPRAGEVSRARLASIVHAAEYRVEAEQTGSETSGETAVTRWKLKTGGEWTVPAVELSRGKPSGTVVLVADGGRASVAAEAERILASGKRVLAVDPFYFGESKIAGRDFLFALLVAAVGERPLGIQASQVAAIARWAQGRGLGPVTVLALGPRSSLFALVAAALEERAIAGVELRGALGSLREVIERNWSADKYPEMFCFGLLEAFDLPEIRSLVAPRPVEVSP